MGALWVSLLFRFVYSGTCLMWQVTAQEPIYCTSFMCASPFVYVEFMLGWQQQLVHPQDMDPQSPPRQSGAIRITKSAQDQRGHHR